MHSGCIFLARIDLPEIDYLTVTSHEEPGCAVIGDARLGDLIKVSPQISSLGRYAFRHGVK